MQVLSNGCSHTRAVIPDATAEEHNAAAWPRILEKLIEAPVVNIARGGKANHVILEETIRVLLNPHNFTHVVVQTSDFDRINFYKKRFSGLWEPGDIDSQTQRLNPRGSGQWYVKIPGKYRELDLRVSKSTPDRAHNVYEIGDTTWTYERIVLGTLINCLYNVCQQQGITLSVMNYFGFHTAFDDHVFGHIPEEVWVADDPRWGFYNDLLWRHDTPDSYHFSKTAHPEIAELVKNHILHKEKVILSTVDYDDMKRLERSFNYD